MTFLHTFAAQPYSHTHIVVAVTNNSACGAAEKKVLLHMDDVRLVFFSMCRELISETKHMIKRGDREIGG